MSDSPLRKGISEKEFLNNYIRFAAVHRWTVAKTCFGRYRELDGSSPERAHLALEIHFCYLLLMEDILMWHYALKELQQSSSAHLMDILNGVNLSPAARSQALGEMQTISDAEFMSLLGFQAAQTAPMPGLSVEECESVRAAIVVLKTTITNGMKSFVQGKSGVLREGTLVRCLNKIKHGLLVMRMQESEGQPEFVAVFPKGTEFDFATDQVSLPSIFPKQESLQNVLSEIETLTSGLVGMLTVLFLTRFKDRPAGTPPDELVRAISGRNRTKLTPDT